MIYPVGIENNYQDRSLAWVLDSPGCFAYGANAEQAIANTPQAIADYAEWVATRSAGQILVDSSQIELALGETWECYLINQRYEPDEAGRYEVNAWFHSDWKPLSADEIERAAQLLAWTRADLLDVVDGLSPEALAADHPGERWSIARILKHVGGSEWWYLNRLSLAFEEERLSDDPFERLSQVRTNFIEALPTLLDAKTVVGMEGEFWSPRKVIRRALWHERDHTQHILKLLAE